MAVEKVVNYILDSFEKKMVVGGKMLDLSKAFDMISHEILCRKLHFYGIKRHELQLIVSYLRDRYQIVKISDNIKSDPRKALAGVPQGSVLGPFLFLVFINDFNANIPGFSVLYADDTSILDSNVRVDSVLDSLALSMDRSKVWYEANRLSLNEEKTENILFTLRNNLDIEYKEYLKPVKLLGIILDSKLSWSCHVEYLCKKLARVMYLLRKLKSCVSKEILILTYYGLFHSQLNYGLRLWGNSSETKKVFIWQKKAIRCIVGLKSTDSCKNSFSELNVMTLPSMYIYCNLIYVKNKMDDFQRHCHQHEYLTRNRENLVTPNVRLSKTLKSHKYQQHLLFNKLPLTVRSLPNKKFTPIVSAWLKKRSFYSLEEYLNCVDNDIMGV